MRRVTSVLLFVAASTYADDDTAFWDAVVRREAYLRGRTLRYWELDVPRDSPSSLSLCTVARTSSGLGEVWARASIGGTTEEVGRSYTTAAAGLMEKGPLEKESQARVTLYGGGRTLNLLKEQHQGAPFWVGMRFAAENRVFRAGSVNACLFLREEWLSAWRSRLSLVHAAEREADRPTFTYVRASDLAGANGPMFVVSVRCRRDWELLPELIVDARVPAGRVPSDYAEALRGATRGVKVIGDIEVMGVRTVAEATVVDGQWWPAKVDVWYAHLPDNRLEGCLKAITPDNPGEVDLFGDVSHLVSAPCAVFDEFTREQEFYGDWDSAPLDKWKEERVGLLQATQEEEEQLMRTRVRSNLEQGDGETPGWILPLVLVVAGVAGLVLSARRAVAAWRAGG